MNKRIAFPSLVASLGLLFAACTVQSGTATQIAGGSGATNPAGENSIPAISNQVFSPTETQESTSPPTSVSTSVQTSVPMQQATVKPQPVGPELADFPQGVNPMTGLPVADPAQLNLPAVLL